LAWKGLPPLDPILSYFDPFSSVFPCVKYRGKKVYQ